MREGVFPVISVAAFGKTEFQHFVKFLEQRNGLIGRGKACRGKLVFYLPVNIFRAGMTFTGG
jgi:hypothetical protein